MPVTAKKTVERIGRSIPLCFLLLLCCATIVSALDPNKRLSQYTHKNWTTRDGVFAGIPRNIVQTKDGYIWIGTTEGLVRFDGIRFETWVPPDGQKLPDSRINSLLADKDGSLWIGTSTGLSHWQNNHLVYYAKERGVVTSIIQAHDGAIWIQITGPPTGPLCQVVGEGMQCHGKADGIPEVVYVPIAQDNHDNFWIGGDGVLVRWSPDAHRLYKVPGLEFNKKGDGSVKDVAASPDGSVWAGVNSAGRGFGLQRLVQDAWKSFVTREFDGSKVKVLALLLDHNNALWVGTVEQGLYRIVGGEVEHFGIADGLTSDEVFKIFEDREGNVWVVTSKGMDSFHDVRVASFSNREGLAGEEVNSVYASRDGTVWIGSSGSLNMINHGRVSSIREGKSLPGSLVTSFFEDHLGQIWIGLDRTLRIYKGGKFQEIKKPNGESIGMIVGITEGADNNIWVESRPPSLFRVQSGKVQEEFPLAQVPSARRIAAGPDGVIWLGLANGDYAKFHGGHVDTVHIGLNVKSRAEQLMVNPDGSVLSATTAGMIGLRQGQQLTMTVKNGLPCDGVYAFQFDDQSNLWLYMQCGLVEIGSVEMQKWWGRADTVVKFKLFDVFDGAQPALAPFNTSAKSRDGRLWFAAGVQLQMVDPAHVADNPIQPPVHVERIVADRRPYRANDGILLPPLTRDLEIDYTALSFVAPQKVRFRYRLEGHDAGWQEPGTRRQAFYNDLRPGKYRFRVIACNNDGVWNEQGAALNFIVAPAWFQTIWFRALCVFAGGLLLLLFYQLRVRQVARLLATRFDERLAERTRVARELHDTLLQTVQGSKLVADDALKHASDPARLRSVVEKLSVWLGRATDEGRAALNSLRASTAEKNDLAESFRGAIEDCRRIHPIAAFFSVTGQSREMHPMVRDEVYRIGYEAIFNACAHSGGTRLDVTLSYAHDLSVRVRDNGKGIDATIVDKGKEGHFGLQGMRERADRIGAKLIVVSPVGSGTEVLLVVPGRIVFRVPTAPIVQRIKDMFGRNRRSGNSD